MSQLGTPYSPPPPYAPPPVPPPSRPTSEDIPGWVVLTAAAVCMALAGLLGYVVLNSKSDPAPPAPAPARHVFPAHWNHKIAPYARIAARERGLKFEHPVAVRFLSPQAFRKSLRAENGKITRKDRRTLTQTTGLLRALGLVSGKVDLLSASRQAGAASTLAYYSFKDKSITVRGHTITASMKSTLVHELTHVLQDQHFHVGARLKKLEKASKNGPTTSAGDVLDAIVEGDARRVEARYRDSLNAAQRKALDAAQHAESSRAQPGLAGIPKIIVAMNEAPYDLGLDLTTAASLRGGNAAVDRLLRRSPTHDSVLLDPLRQLTGTAGAAHVAVPALAPGDKKFDSGEFGAVSWYFVLSSRIPLTQALAAADGWGGDAFVAYQHHGTSCARLDFTGRTAADTTRMYGALQQWVAASPGGGASVRRTANGVLMQSCDPGTGVRSGNESSIQALSLVATRNGIENGLVRSGGTPQLASCFADQLVQSYTVAQLNDPAFGKNDAAVQAQLRDLAASCR